MDTFQKIMFLIIFKLSTLNAMPLQFPLLQPLPGTLQQQQLALQEQMLAIQQFQALQGFNAIPSPLTMRPQQPFLVLIPNMPVNIEKDERFTKLDDNFLTRNKPIQEIDNDDSDSISIDAEPEANLPLAGNSKISMRAVLLLPNSQRFSIGGFISSLPFLPIEINVPDSISWIYEGISGIISGIGQRWPFNIPQAGDDQNESTKFWKDLKTKKIMPVLVMPLGQPTLPMQI